jgi:gluconolactonase
MKLLIIYFSAILLLTSFYFSIAGDYPTIGRIHRLDKQINKLIPQDAKLEKIAEGFEWSEGPVWIPDEKYLLFSDIPNNVINRWRHGEGISIFIRPAGYSGSDPLGAELGTNGLILDLEGNLVVCDHGNRCVSRIDTKIFTREILVDNFQGKRLNSPNDLVYNSQADLYFTDPPYGLKGLNKNPKKELDFNGVFMLRKTGELILLTKEMTFPNGIGLSPDENTMYVAQSDENNPIIKTFDITSDGKIKNGRLFFDAMPWKQKKLGGLPDGLVVDQTGNIWASAPGGIHILSADGKHLGWIETGQATANCTFGDDGSILYITADMFLCRIKTMTKGIGF